MTVSVQSAARLLARHGLLREIIAGGRWTLDAGGIEHADRPFTDVTYDTRQVRPGTLLFCKGNFKDSYLDGVDERGLAAYVAQRDLSAATDAPGLIVDDVRRAMSLLSAEFFGRPQDELTVIGITGTKGKTTTAYFTHAILAAHSNGRAALFSSVDNCIDGRTWTESDLTTPESLDAFRMMREAVDAGMRYLVMEVSSQAYKVERVYGLTFDAGAFLNISPDHLSPIEHPTFEDYLHCKRRIVAASRTLVLGADADHADLIRQDAAAAGVPLTSFAVRDEDGPADADIVATPLSASASTWRFRAGDRLIGDIALGLEGAFNAANAAAAIGLALAVGVPADSDAFGALAGVRIAGRMERYRSGNIVAYVDYAHNFVSATTLLDFVRHAYGDRDPHIIVVTGSTGDKAFDRREGIITAVQDHVDRIILTSEDTIDEPMIDICRQMQGYVTNPHVACDIVIDRAAAIAEAVADARAHAARLSVLLVIGKGEERWIKMGGRHVDYEGDDRVVKRLLGVETPR